MSKGRKSKRQKSASQSSESRVKAQLSTAAPEQTRQQKCSNCGTFLDRSKTPDNKCWLCAETNFVDPTDLELEERRKRLERKELCCPNPACPRPWQLLANKESFCGGCGAELETPTIRLWLRRCVEPVWRKGPISPASRLELIDAAWELGFSRESVEVRFDKEIELLQQAELEAQAATGSDSEQPRSEPVTTALPPGDPSPPDVALWPGREAAPDAVIEQSTPPHHQKAIDHLRWRIKMKYRAAIWLILIFLLCALAVRFRGRTNNDLTNKPGPSPTVPTPAPAPVKPDPPAGMVLIEGGAFIMGRDRSEGGDQYEAPAHEVKVTNFYLDAHEVTREEFQKCVAAGACQPPYGWTDKIYPPDTGRWPVTGITWQNADAYAKSLGKRLPTEEEWEFAARGLDGKRYPWGDTWLSRHANIGSTSLREIGRYQSYRGLVDMVGNAMEWTSSEWKRYPGKTDFIRTKEQVERLRVIRGGSYKSSPAEATLTYRNALRMREDQQEEDHYEQTGFRCVQDYRNP